jgi:hypothetical protein
VFGKVYKNFVEDVGCWMEPYWLKQFKETLVLLNCKDILAPRFFFYQHYSFTSSKVNQIL